LPNPRLKSGSSIRLSGEIPSPINLPPACYLAGRCPLAIEQCRQDMPPVEAVADNHTVRCYRHREVAGMDKDFDSFARFQDEADRILGAGVPKPATSNVSEKAGDR
jgi:oligopeptide/dipeptide ABC transporter ATP-binding protein